MCPKTIARRRSTTSSGSLVRPSMHVIIICVALAVPLMLFFEAPVVQQARQDLHAKLDAGAMQTHLAQQAAEVGTVANGRQRDGRRAVAAARTPFGVAWMLDEPATATQTAMVMRIRW